VLPAAAFTEEDGTIIDHANEVHNIRKAVGAPASALPSWQILCRIAQKLEVPGFEYENEAQIQAELELMNPPRADPEESLLNLFQPDAAVFPSGQSDEQAYMGLPLRTWVGGFQVLYPEHGLRIK
jgi:predicted molibdopterin-dependent oxidoreductase YjgC